MCIFTSGRALDRFRRVLLHFLRELKHAVWVEDVGKSTPWTPRILEEGGVSGKHASGFTVVTGHEDPAAARHLDWDALAQLGTTLVVLMGASRAGAIAERLLAAGMDPDTPVAAIQSATTPAQHTLRTTLSDLDGRPVDAPAVLVVGSVAALDVTDEARLDHLVADLALAEPPAR